MSDLRDEWKRILEFRHMGGTELHFRRETVAIGLALEHIKELESEKRLLLEKLKELMEEHQQLERNLKKAILDQTVLVSRVSEYDRQNTELRRLISEQRQERDPA